MNEEDEKERRDRQLIELLNELRVALPGVQVLFAFLLIVPFSQRFPDVTPLQRYAYFATLSCTAVSAILLIAPSSHHRLLWRQHANEETLRTSNRLTIAGLAFLTLAMTGAVFTITDFLFGGTLSAMVAVGIGAAFAWFWYVRPLLRLRDWNGVVPMSARPKTMSLMVTLAFPCPPPSEAYPAWLA